MPINAIPSLDRSTLYLAQTVSEPAKTQHSFLTPTYDDGFQRPLHNDLPIPDENTFRRFWEMFRRQSAGLRLVDRRQDRLDEPPAGEPCIFISSDYLVYVMATEYRCNPYERVHIIKSRCGPGGGGGLSVMGSGASVSIPSDVFDLWEYKVGVQYTYELRAAVIDDLYVCDNGTRVEHRLYNWYLGWGLVAIGDPKICSSTKIDEFSDIHAAQAHRQELGGSPSHLGLNLRDS
ncbi:MAG: hypothetical protein AAFY29_19490 [Pseudomonadota bacterium]